jgi:hypothetical protein
MRKAFCIILVVLVGYPVCSFAVTGLSLGGKVGYANYSGDVLPASGDVGNAFMYGAILEIATLPVVDFELHANYFAKDFSYTYDVGGNPVSTDFQFRDFSLLALVKKNLITLPASPLGLYIGGGVGWHLINTEVAKDIAAGNDPANADDPIALFKNSAKMSGHALAGVKLSLPVVPLAFYGETRYGVIFTDEHIKTFQLEGGVMLKF